MSSYVTDTHALLWHLSLDSSLSRTAAGLFRQADAGNAEIVVPSIVLVEVIYLSERQRVPGDRVERILSLVTGGRGSYRLAELDEAVVRALRRIPRADVPDLPDRVIAATSLYLGLPLITRDRRLKGCNLLRCVW